MKRKLTLVLCVLLAFGFFEFAYAKKKIKKTDFDRAAEKAAEKKVVLSADRYENLALFQKVLYFIEQNYVEDVKNKDLIYGAIKGMIDTLDPHSSFLPPEIFKDMKIDTSGKFGGVGIEIGMKNSILTVITPIEDTPAFKAGIKPGDKILKINGESTKGLGLVEAVAKMRGSTGSPVTISVWREGFEKPRDFKITRAEIKIRSVKKEELEPGYLYLRLTNFNERSFDDLKKALTSYEEKNGKLKGLIFDLRNNPGGLLDQAVDITSLFLDEGIVVSTMGKNEDSKEIKYAKKGFARKDFPIAVLVNGATASAAEIVSGALQDHRRAIIMGQPTFGKGSVQTVVELQSEVGLKLTIARYYTPSGRSIQLKGIEPDVRIAELDQKTIAAASSKDSYIRERDLKHSMGKESRDKDDESEKDIIAEEYANSGKTEKADKKDEVADTKSPKEDYQVREALNYMKSSLAFQNTTASGRRNSDADQSRATKENESATD
ncbi:MAG: S41 family peptidase [Bacteriovoracia bacterium]